MINMNYQFNNDSSKVIFVKPEVKHYTECVCVTGGVCYYGLYKIYSRSKMANFWDEQF